MREESHSPRIAAIACVMVCVCDDSVVDKDLYMRIIAEAAITILPLFILKEKAAFC
jgi:hypothetical protein